MPSPTCMLGYETTYFYTVYDSSSYYGGNTQDKNNNTILP